MPDAVFVVDRAVQPFPPPASLSGPMTGRDIEWCTDDCLPVLSPMRVGVGGSLGWIEEIMTLAVDCAMEVGE